MSNKMKNNLRVEIGPQHFSDTSGNHTKSLTKKCLQRKLINFKLKIDYELRCEELETDSTAMRS